ncbi:hypothetical protein FB45DRAFT_988318 [Roridomyces roridus]|uniref:Uncharacterized protein n=1 Tax=Roridomyces roridus TaxID=1738132 RepID=A0AAD7C8V8_9AGAR|nr:hypothetical protein FB45DRAFT_988318 [Roridomyces roridus]
MLATFTFMLSITLLASTVQAICPGFNYAVGQGNGINRWDVYDDSCNIVDSLTTNLNPCDQSTFGCSPPPIIFNRYTNTFTGLVYACRTDPQSGVCGNDVISVCCRNDGN